METGERRAGAGSRNGRAQAQPPSSGASTGRLKSLETHEQYGRCPDLSVPVLTLPPSGDMDLCKRAGMPAQELSAEKQGGCRAVEVQMNIMACKRACACLRTC
jgi:hypothetical protein